MQSEVSIKQCESCNSACCVIFSLHFSRFDMLKALSGSKVYRGYAKSVKSDCLKGLVFFRKISHLLDRKVTVYARESGNIYSCILVRNGKCALYSVRPNLCRLYNCYGGDQLAHTVPFNGKVVERLNKIIEVKDELKNEVTEENACVCSDTHC